MIMLITINYWTPKAKYVVEEDYGEEEGKVCFLSHILRRRRRWKKDTVMSNPNLDRGYELAEWNNVL